MSEEQNQRTELEIAIIGMSGRFPGASNIDEFWENLKSGVESISFFSEEELEASGITAETYNAPGYIKAKGALGDIESFDSAFFNYTPREAAIMDPQTRLFHECAWEALENAGYNPDTFPGQIGLYAGASANFHWVVNTMLFQVNDISTPLESILLNNKDYMSTRIAYKLNLKGPGLMVQTACSTSLAAIHMAYQSLLMGECEMAMAGGITVSLPSKTGYYYSDGMIVSPDGHTRAFDEKGEGFVDGNGIGIVVLKRLEDALKDRDHIYALIIGSALNNDGSRRVGYTAPSVEGQADVIRAARQMAEIPADSVTYIETHGTATSLGDPIEIEALKRALDMDSGDDNIKKYGEKKYCAIGSVKTNVGHMDSAAGVAGLIKTALALKHRVIPPSLNYQTPNPRLRLEDSPFYVNTELKEWVRGDTPLRAGVSSFGIGGTNAHIVMEEAPSEADIPAIHDREDTHHLILLSTKSEAALERATQNLGNHLKQNPGLDPADIAYTLQAGRKAFDHRRMLVAGSTQDISEALLSPGSGKVRSNVTPLEDRPVVFMFPGLGTQYTGMGRQLYHRIPVFREEMDRCFDIYKEITGEDISVILYPANGDSGEDHPIQQTQYAQPIVFMFEYALARMLMTWGIKPHSMIGYSFGEYVAACIAGVFSLEDALKLVVIRGQLIGQLPSGAMMSVPLPEDQLKPLLDKRLAIAIDNGSACIVSGPEEAVADFEQQMKQKRLLCVRLQASHALHSGMMDSVLKRFETAVAGLTLNKPEIPYISNVTGKWITVEDATDPRYWVDHMRKTVRFAAGLEELVKKKNILMVEVGPGVVLSTLALQYLDKNAKQMAVNLLRAPEQKTEDMDYLLKKLGRMWLYGKRINWEGLYGESKHRRLPLPTYSFDKLHYPVDISRLLELLRGEAVSVGATGTGVEEKLFMPSWKSTAPKKYRADDLTDSSGVLVMTDNAGSIAAMVADKLRQDGVAVVMAQHADRLEKVETTAHHYRLDMENPDHYALLLNELRKTGSLPDRVVFTGRTRGLVYLANAVEDARNQCPEISGRVHIIVAASGTLDVYGENSLLVDSEGLAGAVKIIPHYYPGIRFTYVDFPPITNDGSNASDTMVLKLAAEITVDDPPAFSIVALRGFNRLVQTYETVETSDEVETGSRLKKEGVYMITNGTDGAGLVLARNLAQHLQARLILTDASPFPAYDKWDQWLEEHDPSDTVSMKIQALQKLEIPPSGMMVVQAHLSDPKQLQDILSEADARFGTIDGVIYTTMNDADADDIVETGARQLDEMFRDQENQPGFFAFCSPLGIGSDSGKSLLTQSQLNAFADGAFFDTMALSLNHRSLDSAVPFAFSIHWDAQWAGSNAFAVFQNIIDGSVPIVSVSRQDLKQLTRDGQCPVSGPVEKETGSTDMQTPEGNTAANTGYVAPVDKAQQMIADAWQDILGIESIGIHDNFFEMGGDSLKGISFINRFKDLLGEILHITIMFDAPTIAELAAYFKENYPVGYARMVGEESTATSRPAEGIITREKLEYIGSIVPPLQPLPADNTPKNPPAVFILSPPRTGSTLFRVILGGHPQLVAPPELNLLEYNTLQQRKSENTGHAASHLQGTIRAIMQIHNCDADEAQRKMDACEEEGLTVKQFYRRLQQWIGDRILVDKSPGYAMNIETLRRTETYFQDPLFIHLLRHPYGMVRSYMEAKLDLLMDRSMRSALPYSRRELGELSWTVSENNIIEFLKDIPQERQLQVRFEDLVADPGTIVPNICNFLGLDFNPDMLHPYKEKKKRMTDGVHSEGIMLGDMKFHRHSSIDPKVADTWKEVFTEDFLGEPTLDVARQFGYQTIAEMNGISGSVDQPSHPVSFAQSFAQERLWFLDQLEGQNSTYNMWMSLRLKGNLDIPKLHQSFNEIVRRHEILRTIFTRQEGRAVQQIIPHLSIPLPVVDMTDMSDITKAPDTLDGTDSPAEETLKALAIKEVEIPFDLQTGPLMRVKLIKIATDEYLLLITMHHIISDAWSMKIFIHEMTVLYDAYTRNQSRFADLPELTIQYKEYAAWQRDHLSGAELEKQVAFWKNHLAGAPPVLELPLDFPRPPVQTFNGGSQHFQIDRDLTGGLRRLAQDTNTTLFMVLLSSFTFLLVRYSGMEDIVIGTPVANREQSRFESLIGFFISTLILRLDFSGNPTFNELLKRVRRVSLDAYAHQDVPFEKLVEELNPQRNLSHSPLFQVLFALQSVDLSGPQHPDLTITPFDIRRRTAKFDLHLSLMETGDIISADFEYCADLFEAGTISRMIDNFLTLMKDIVDHPDDRLSGLSMLTETRKRLVLEEWNDTTADYPRDKTIHQLFAEQAQRTPAAEALVFDNMETGDTETLTYKRLNDNADNLAYFLREKGLQPGVIAAIMIEPLVQMIVALLAVLKAGGTYLPIDYKTPLKRIDYMLKDSCAQLILTRFSIMQTLTTENIGPGGSSDIMVDLSEESLYEPPYEQFKLPSYATPDDAAYVIYTSGSTGKPKGVMVEHRNVANFIAAMSREIPFKPGKTILALTTISFDIFVLETLVPLTQGVKVVIAAEDLQKDPALLREIIAHHHVDMLQVTPSRLQLLLMGENGAGALNGINHLIVGGEAFPLESLKRLQKEGFAGEIINVYGPTETTVWSTLKNLTTARKITIGHPVANTRIYIIGSGGVLQPADIPGELCIAGDGVVRGYLNNPQLTDEKFVPDPYRQGQPMYRTGDLARRLGNGDIEFLGRTDFQVKIRGFRIELGEIETRLLEYPGIEEAVVIVREDIAGDKLLCAYIIGNLEDASNSSTDALKNHLQQTLPEYMVPTHFIFLETMPLTTSGKVNRNQLPAPQVEAGDGYIPPANPLEEQLAAIWSDVLGIDKDVISMNAGFFDLGGHSLKATLMVEKIHKNLDVKVPLTQLFKKTRIRELAQYIDGLSREKYQSIEPVPIMDHYELSSAQQRFYLLQQMEPDSTAYNLPSVDRLKGPLQMERFKDVFKTLISRHESLRTSFRFLKGRPVQEIHDAGSVPFEIEYHDAVGRDSDAVHRIVRAFVRPFDLDAAPLLRVGLVKTAQQEHVLMFDMHHIVTDGFSMGILIKDFMALYAGDTLPPLPLQAKDFSQWQFDRLAAGHLKKEEEYWLSEFSGELPLLNMPLDFPRPQVQSFEGDTLVFSFDETLTAELNRMIKETGTTLYIALLTIFYVILGKYSGQSDIIIGSTIAGRNHADLENIIGLLFETLAIRNYPESHKTFRQFLEEVKERSLKAYENQAYPFGELVKRFVDDNDHNRSRNPLFDVMLIVQNIDAVPQTVAVGDLKIMPFDEEAEKVAKLDITIEARETRGTVTFKMEYCTKLFKRETMERFSDGFKKIAAAAIENIDIKLKDIEVSHDLITATSSVYDDAGDFDF